MIDICLCGIARVDCDYHKPPPVPSKIPVYDVTGTSFIAGVTNFTADHLFEAMAGLDASPHYSLKMDGNIFYRLDSEGLLYIVRGQYMFQALPVFIGQMKGGPIFSTLLLNGIDVVKVIIMTREW